MRKSEFDQLGFENGRITGFEPRYRSIDDDWERYTDALVELADRGVVPRKKGQSLYGLYCSDLSLWLTDLYFQKGLLDLIEAYHTPSGEVSFAPLYETQLKVLERFEAMGEGARARRIWRAHTGLLKSTYWWYVGEKSAGFRKHDYDFSTEAEQRRKYGQLIGRIPDMKAELLAIMADYRAVAERTGATDAELARIKTDIAAIEAEERPRPSGKPDPRKMDEDVFWELIDHGLGTQPLGERLDTLPERLARFKATAIRAFDKILREMDARAYRWDVWALAYLLQGGCSDDSFEEFRGWLILQGRAVFEATLADPDGFDVGLHTGQASGMTGLRDAAPQAYEMRQGKAMPPVKVPLREVSGPEIAEEDFAAALPRIARERGV